MPTRFVVLILLGALAGASLYLAFAEPRSERASDDCQGSECWTGPPSASFRSFTQPELAALLVRVPEANAHEAAAVEATGELTVDFDQSIDELSRLAHDSRSSEVKLRVIKSFEFREEPEAVDGILDFISDSDRAVRIATVEALEGHPQPRVLDALNQAVALERDAAVERLMLSALDELASEASPVGQHEALP